MMHYKGFKNILMKGSCVMACMSLLGCQAVDMRVSDYFKNHSKDYLVTGVIAPLQVPDDFTHMVENQYPLPCPLPAPGSVEPPSICPPGFGELT